MKRVIYSPDMDAFKRVCPAPKLYIAPKFRLPALRKNVPCPLVAVEDVEKTNTWLWLNEVVSENMPVIYDRVSRYCKIDSDKSRKLSRLAEIGSVYLVDIVPFCEHRKNLYTTLRYVSRSILGYQHYYAFSGEHAEEIDGRIISSLDADLLARKIAPHVVACEPRHNCHHQTVRINFSENEHGEYAAKREHLFAKYKTPQPIVTRLADLSHAFQSRRDAVCSLLNAHTAVICNMATYAAYYRSKVRGVTVGTYAKPPKQLSECQRVVFAEPPIVLTYKRMDIESNLAEGTEVIDIIGDAKVDTYLHRRIADELGEIDGFTEKLRARLQTEKCP